MGTMQVKLLVVDDEEDLAEFVADVAEDANFEASFISDPLEFSSYYRNDIEIFVLDLFMPGIDGIELLRFLADNKSKASVLFMSGKDKSVLRAAQELAVALNITVLGAIQKPFRAAELEDVLKLYTPPKEFIQTQSRFVPSVEDIRSALDEEQFYLVYQPQVALKDHSIVGVEALIRWPHTEHGFVPPDIFIPLAEEHGQIHDITWYVAKEALRQAGVWHRAGIDIRVSINMSPKTFEDLDLPEKLSAMALALGADIEKIVIEVTETALMVDVARYIDVLTRLRMKGFWLSIDDFGTGYSSLLQLIRVSFNELKIDKTFIDNILSDAECRIITEISYMLANKLGMHVVAEGIENEETWNQLCEIGCEEAQGYWIAKPMKPELLVDWAQDWSDTHGLKAMF